MENRVVIKQDVLKQVGVAVLSIFMILNSAFAIVIGTNFIIKVIGWIGVLFFGYCSFFIFKRLFFPKDLLIIDTNGFIDNSTAMASGKMISWEQVHDINILYSWGEKFIAVDMVKPDEYLQTLSLFKRLMSKANYRCFSSVIQINLNASKAKYEDILNIMKSYMLDDKKKEEQYIP